MSQPLGDDVPPIPFVVFIMAFLVIGCCVLLYFAVRLLRTGRGGTLRRLVLLAYGLTSFGLACAYESYRPEQLTYWPEQLTYWIGATILWLCLHYAIPPSRT